MEESEKTNEVIEQKPETEEKVDKDAEFEKLMTKIQQNLEDFHLNDLQETFVNAYELSKDNKEQLARMLAKQVLYAHLSSNTNQKFFKEFRQSFTDIKNFDDTWKDVIPLMYDDVNTLYRKFFRNIKSFFYSETGVFQIINAKLADETIEMDDSFFELLIAIFQVAKGSLKGALKSDFSVAALNRIIKKYEGVEGENVRKIDEKQLKTDLNVIRDCLPSAESKRLTKFETDLAITFALSPILGKKFDALQRFSQMKSFSKELVQEITEKSIIDNLMADMHQDLAAPFVQFLLKLWDAGAFNEKVLSIFWQISLDQLASVIDKFFKQWPILFENLPRGKQPEFWAIVLQTKTFPPSCLAFLEKIASKSDDETKQKMVDCLWQASESDRKPYIKALTAYIVESPASIKNKYTRLCIKNIEEGKDVSFSLMLLQSIWKPTNEETTRKDLHTVLTKTQVDPLEPKPLFGVVIKFCESLKDPLPNDEVEIIKTQLASVYDKDMKVFSQFIKQFFTLQKGKIVSQEQAKKFIEWLIDLPGSDGKAFNDIKFIFESINNINPSPSSSVQTLNLIGMQSMWNLFFKTEFSNVIDYIVGLVTRCTSSDAIPTFVKSCLDRDFSKATIHGLTLLISKVEDPLNLEALGIKRNLFSSPNSFVNITLKDASTETIRIPCTMPVPIFKAKVGYIVGCEANKLEFKIYEKDLEDNHRWRNGETVCVSAPVFKTAPRQWKKEELPSQVIKKPETMNALFNILDAGNKEVSVFALSLLNFLETSPAEKAIFRTQNIDWKAALCIDKPFLFLYRLNMLGNILSENNKVFILNVYKTGGFKALIEVMLGAIKNLFVEERYLLLFLTIVSYLINSCITVKEAKEIKDQVYKEIGVPKATEAIMNWIVDLLEKPSSTIVTMLAILRDIISIEPEALISNPNFPSFFKKLIFAPLESIQRGFAFIVKDLNPKLIEKIVIDELETSKTQKLCANYYDVVNTIAGATEDPKGLWSLLINTVRDGLLTPSPTAKLPDDFEEKERAEDPALQPDPEDPSALQLRSMQRRCFSLQQLKQGVQDTCSKCADATFIAGIYNCLVTLVPRIEGEIPNAGKFAYFSLNRIYLNQYKFIPSPYSLIILIKKLCERNPEIITSAVNLISYSIYNFNTTKDTGRYYSQLNSTCDVRGINNMGCTCYLNSSLQQIFRIDAIREALLKYDPQGYIQTDWAAQLQLIFAKLLYYPSTAIDASPFVMNFKIMNRPIRPTEQMDAQEFICCLLDKLDETLPSKPVTNSVIGSYQHVIISTTPGKEWSCENSENFTTLSLEVLGQKDIQDSFNAFKIPDVIPEYNTDEVGQVQAERHNSILKAPDVLIAQLKRFDFDLETCERKKINSEYKFPIKLDISPIMSKSQQGEPCNYELAGVIIHSGSAGGGHYYSYVRDIHNEDQWLNCNDSSVSQITETYVLNNSTGGKYLSRYTDRSSRNTVEKMVERCDNAYILVYKKSDRQKPNFDVEPLCTMPPVMIDSFLQEIRFSVLRSVMFTDGFYDLISFLAEKLDTVELHTLLFNYMIKCTESNSGERLGSKAADLCIEKIKNSEMFAKMILQRYDLIDIMYKSTKQQTKDLSAKLICQAIESSMENAKPIIDIILSKIPELYGFWENFDYVFHPLLKYIELMKAEDSNELPKLITGKLMEFVSVTFQSTFAPNDVQAVLTRINLSTVFKTMRVAIEKWNLQEDYQDMVLQNEEFMTLWFSSQLSVFEFAKLVSLFLKDNEEQTNKYLEMIKNSNITVTTLAAHIANAVSFQDTLTDKRVQFLFDFLKEKKYEAYDHVNLYRLIKQKLQINAGCALDSLMKVKDLWLKENIKSQDQMLRSAVLELTKCIFTDVSAQETQNDMEMLPDKPPEIGEEQKAKLKELFEYVMKSIYPEMNPLFTKAAKAINNPRHVYNALQTTEFYSLLTWIVYNGSLQEDLLKYKDLIFDSYKVLSKLSNDNKTGIYDITRFLSIVTKGHPEFFSDEKHVSTLIKCLNKVPDYPQEYISRIVPLLFPVLKPVASKNAALISKSDIFTAAIEYGLSTMFGPIIISFVEEMVQNNDALEIISKTLFDEHFISFNLSNRNASFFTLTKNLLMKNSIPVDIFIKNKCVNIICTDLKKELAKIKTGALNTAAIYDDLSYLTVFNRALEANPPPKTFFGGDQKEKMAQYWLTMKDLFMTLATLMQQSSTSSELINHIIEFIASVFCSHHSLHFPGIQLFNTEVLTKIQRDSTSAFVEFRTNCILLAAHYNNPQRAIAITVNDISKLDPTIGTAAIGFYAKLISDLYTKMPNECKKAKLDIVSADFFNTVLSNATDLLIYEGAIAKIGIEFSSTPERIGDVTNWLTSCLKLIIQDLKRLGEGEEFDVSLESRRINAAVNFFKLAYEALKVEHPKINAPKSIVDDAIAAINGKSDSHNSLCNTLQYFKEIFNQ